MGTTKIEWADIPGSPGYQVVRDGRIGGKRPPCEGA